MPLSKQMIASKKRQALQYKKDRPQLSSRELANLTGLSQSTIERTLKKMSQDERKDSLHQANITIPSDESPIHQTQDDEDKTTLDFEESPEPVEQRGLVDSAFHSLKGMLGISEKPVSAGFSVALSAKLDAKRQKFVDAVSPTLALAAISIAAYLWGRIGPEYAALAPDENVARQIVEPLLRVYARHANFLVDVNPDVADIGASVLALVGYINVSLSLYQQIKLDQEEQDYEEQGNSRESRIRRRSTTHQSENGTGNTGRGHADVRRPDGPDDPGSRQNGRSSRGVDQIALTDKEARQHAALSRLSELDYQHRARRSMRAS